MLKVNADAEGKDYVEYLMPFAKFALAKHRPNPVTQERLQELLNSEFGLTVSLRGCGLVIRRLARRGLLRKRDSICRIEKDIEAPDIPADKAAAERRLDELTDNLRKFVTRKFDLLWSAEQAHSALIQYLSRFSIECLRSYTSGSALPRSIQSSQRDLFVTSAFANELKETNQHLFDSLITFVKGNMLANALLCPDLEALHDKFQDVTFYLDTPLILHLLGLQGEPNRLAAAELLTLVTNLRGRLAIFSHTNEEVYSVIRACEQNLNDPAAKGKIISEMRRSNKTASDLAMVRANLDSFFAEHSIVLRDTPPYGEDFQIDESILESTLDDDVGYFNPRALHYDINSIRSVYALRRGKAPTRLERAGVVFVTTNAALARVAYEYGKDFESSREVSSVISDFSLANMAWLKAPLQAPDLPRLELIAMCHAAMKPREALWSKYVTEIDKLKTFGSVTPEMHAILRYSLRAEEELMNLTLGSEEEFSERTVDQIIERVEQQLASASQEELQAERNRTRELGKRLDEASGKVSVLTGHIGRRSSEIAKGVSRLIMVLVSLILITCAVVTALLTNGLVVNSVWMSIALSLLVWIGAVFAVVNWLVGISVREISARIEVYAQGLVSRHFTPKDNQTDDSSIGPV